MAPNDYSSLPFLERRPSVIPGAPELPPNPSNLDTDSNDLEHLGTPLLLSPSPTPRAPVTPPPGARLAPPGTPHPVRTRSQENSQTRKLTEKGKLFEKNIEAGKDHLMRVREAVAR